MFSSPLAIPMRLQLLTLSFVLLVAEVSLGQRPASAELKLGYVKNASIACGRYVTYNLSDLRRNKYLLVSPMDEDSYVNLNGKNVKVALVAHSKAKERERVGDRSWEIYSGGDLKVKLQYVVTSVCKPGDESCEVSYYRAKMIITRKRQSKIVNAIALFGC